MSKFPMSRFVLRTVPLALFYLLFCGLHTLAQRYDGDYVYRPSTAGESYARGMADLTRSRGVANYANSEAAINLTQATSNHIDNRAKATTTYFSMRAENRQARAAERGPRPTSEQLLHYAQAGKPQQLKPEQLNPSDGQINFPRALRKESFATDRQQLEQISSRRAAAGNKISDDDFYKAQDLIKDMEKDLKAQVSDIEPQEYIDSKQFLQSLAFEWQS